MSTLYVESSAVLAWMLGEPGSRGVLTRINEAETVATSVLTLLESERALIRAEGQHLISAAESHKVRGMLARASSSWVLMEVSGDVLRGAGRVFPVEPVRTSMPCTSQPRCCSCRCLLTCRF